MSASEFFAAIAQLSGLLFIVSSMLAMGMSLTIAQIAESVGFSDAFAFSHFFKRAIGCSPSEFRKQQTPEAGLR